METFAKTPLKNERTREKLVKSLAPSEGRSFHAEVQQQHPVLVQSSPNPKNKTTKALSRVHGTI